MEKQKEHFCWVKLIDDAGALAAAGDSTQTTFAELSGQELSAAQAAEGESLVFEQAAHERSMSRSTYSGGRPPGHSRSLLSGPRPPHAIHYFSGGRPPGRYAGAVLAGWWSIDPDYDGAKSSSTRTDFRPMLGSRDEAIEWLTSDEGEEWLADAMTYFLFCFTTTGDW